MLLCAAFADYSRPRTGRTLIERLEFRQRETGRMPRKGLAHSGKFARRCSISRPTPPRRASRARETSKQEGGKAGRRDFLARRAYGPQTRSASVLVSRTRGFTKPQNLPAFPSSCCFALVLRPDPQASSHLRFGRRAWCIATSDPRFRFIQMRDSRLGEFYDLTPNCSDHATEFQRRLTTASATI